MIDPARRRGRYDEAHQADILFCEVCGISSERSALELTDDGFIYCVDSAACSLRFMVQAICR